MTTIRGHAALLLAMLPALATRSLTTGDDPGAGKPDIVRVGAPVGRAGVLELLESGMISTEEALDLLDGIDQTGPEAGTGDEKAASDRRPGPLAPPARRARPARLTRAGLEAAWEPDDSPDAGQGREGREARRAARQAERETRQAEREARRSAATAGRYDPGFGGKRTFRIQVDDANGSKVNLALPIGFLDTGLKVAERFSPGLLDGAVGNSIRRAVGGGQAGTIIEVDDGAGQHVRIAIE